MKWVFEGSLSPKKNTLSAYIRSSRWNGVSNGLYWKCIIYFRTTNNVFCPSATASYRMKSLLFPKRWLWSLKTWSSGYILISPSGDVVFELGQWKWSPWEGMDRRKLCWSTGSQPWTVDSTSKTFSRKRLTLVIIVCTSKSNVWAYTVTYFSYCRFFWKPCHSYMHASSLTSEGPGNMDGQMAGCGRDGCYLLNHRTFSGWSPVLETGWYNNTQRLAASSCCQGIRLNRGTKSWINGEFKYLFWVDNVTFF